MAEDGQGHGGALAVGHVAEVDAAQLPARPHGRGQPRRDAHKPAVRVVLRRARLAGDVGAVLVQPVFVIQPHARAALHHALHQLEHHVGCGLVQRLVAFGGEALQHHPLVVLDAAHKDGLHIFALVGIGGHGASHLVDSDFRRSHADGRHHVDRAAHAHLARYVHHLLRRPLLHQVGRHPVD